MANKSAAFEAIKDMLQEGIDVTLLKNIIRALHKLNEEAGIISVGEDSRIRVKADIKVDVQVTVSPQIFWDRKPTPSRQYRRNPDGTIALFDDEWDF